MFKIVLLLNAYLNPLTEIAPFRYVTNLATDGQYIYLISPFGFALIDGYSYTFERGIILNDKVEILAPDPFTGFVYYITPQGNLYQYNIQTRFKNFLGVFPGVRSVGVTSEALFLDTGRGIMQIDRFSGQRIGQGAKPGIRWSGEKRNLTRSNEETVFLSPFFFYDRNFGRVDYTVFFKDDSKLLVGTSGDGLYIYSLNTWIREKELRIGPATISVNVMSKDQNSIWIGGKEEFSYRGITQKKGNQWIVYRRGASFGLERDEVYSITSGGNKVFFGTGGGIQVWERGEFSFMDPPQLRPRDIVSLYYNFPDLWAGTDNGLFRVSAASGTVLDMFLPNLYIEDIEKFNGNLYIATNDGLWTLSPKQKKPGVLKDRKNWITFYVYDLLSGKDTLWVASSEGLVGVYREGDSLNFFYSISPFSPKRNPIFEMQQRRGIIYLGTLNGLYIYNPKKDFWKKQNDPPHFSNLPVYTLTLDDDTLWTGTDKGIFIFREDGNY